MNKAPMIRKAVMLAVFSFPLLMLSGCWSSLELNERLFVRMLVVDKTEHGIELTLVFPLPNRLIPGTAEGTGQQEGKAHSYITQAGADIGQAYRNIQANLTRRINFGQTRVIVVGRELAEEGVEPVLEFIGRNAPFYLNSKIYVTTEKAHDIATIATVSERFPSDVAAAFSRFRTTLDTASKDVLAANYNGGDVMLPLLRLSKIRIETEKEKEQMWVHPVGAAVLKEGKMVGTLTMKEMRGGLWILGKLKDAEITVQSPTDGKDVSFLIRNTHTRTKPKLTRGRILIQIETDADSKRSVIRFRHRFGRSSYAEARRTKPEPRNTPENHRSHHQNQEHENGRVQFLELHRLDLPPPVGTHQTALEGDLCRISGVQRAAGREDTADRHDQGIGREYIDSETKG